MVILNWYDGPTSGILICSECGAEFDFLLCDWNRDQTLRVFALSRIGEGTVQQIVELCREEPRWPTWAPSILFHPDGSQRERSVREFIDSISQSKDIASLVVSWSVRTDTALRSRRITQEQAAHASYLLENDTGGATFDWLALLGENRG
jgi:hypothetical protein